MGLQPLRVAEQAAPRRGRALTIPSLNHRTYGAFGNANFTAELAEATETYWLERDDDDDTPVTEEVLLRELEDFVGSTSFWGDTDAANGPPPNGRMKRVLPTGHPVFRNLVATSIAARPVEADFTGGQYGDDRYEVQPVADYAMHHAWELTVKFGQRPYALLNDDVIAGNSSSLDWWDTDGEPVTSTYWPEWLRYVETEFLDRPGDVLKWRKGQMVLQDGARKLPYTALPNVTLPNFGVKVYWYAVPLDYVNHADSYLVNYKNTVNQLPFALDGRTYAPGELLYKGWTTSRYTPPFTVLGPWAGMENARSPAKLCNLILEFVGTTGRRIHNAPAGRDPASYMMAANRNFIANGFNLFIHHSDRKWRYARTVPVELADADNQALWLPQFFSFPHQLLFKDPRVDELD